MSQVKDLFDQLASQLCEDLVVELVGIFEQQFGESEALFEEYFQKRDFKNASLLAHKLKSSARNVGAKELGDLYCQVEKSPEVNLNPQFLILQKKYYEQYSNSAKAWINSA